MALVLAAPVVIVGMRRDLCQRRRSLSPAQRRGLAAFYLLFALSQAASAFGPNDDRGIHAGMAALLLLTVVGLLTRRPRQLYG